MKDIKQFFECCTSSLYEGEVVINMERKERSQSCKTPTKRTFIKRSIGTNHTTGSSAKNTVTSTIRSFSGKENRKYNQTASPHHSYRTNTSFDSSKLDFESHIQNSKISGKAPNNKELYKFIKYDNPRTRHSSTLLANLNPHIFQLYHPPQIPIGVPKLLNHRRHRGQGHNYPNHQAFQHPGIQSSAIRTILQTIEERSSVPSMQESQMHQMRQISSKATLKSNIHQNGSPLSNKYNSMIMKESTSRQSFRMINSENLHDANESNLLAIIGKLQKDNQMLQRELKALLQQESHLLLEKQFNSNRFNRQIAFLHQMQSQYQHKLKHQESNIRT